MTNYNVSVLILSCDQNSDLCRWINKTCDCFLKVNVECVLVTESIVDVFDKRIRAFATNTVEFDKRFVFGLEQCKNDNVIVLLDDYFVHDEYLNIKMSNWLNFIDAERLTALRISKCKKMYIKKKRIRKRYHLLTQIQPYEIDFHPTIWRKKELLEFIKNRSFSPWSLEPCLALFLRDKKSGITKDVIQYDELIIQGSFFRKPYNMYCKNKYVGNKKIAKGKKFLLRSFRVFVFNVSPYWLIHLLRRMFAIKSISAEAEL